MFECQLRVYLGFCPDDSVNQTFETLRYLGKKQYSLLLTQHCSFLIFKLKK